MPINLIFIIVFQAFIWGIVRSLPNSDSLNQKQWMIVAVTGLLLGVSMDLIFGIFGIFRYLPNGPTASAVAPHNLDLYLLLMNAFFSYGIATATLALVFGSLAVNHEKSTTLWLILLGIAIIAGIVGVMFSPERSIALLVSCGLVIVSAGEFILMLNHRGGPLIALLARKSSIPFLKLWIFSVVIGASYELANIFFPFWIWLPNSDFSQTFLRMLMILAGYFALFHPISMIWTLFNPKRKR